MANGPRVGVVEINHRSGKPRVAEKPLLGGAVGFGSAVIVEMVMSQTGEYRYPDREFIQTALAERMRRRFQRHVGAVVSRQSGQHSLKSHGIGRGVGALLQRIKRAVAQGAEVTAAAKQRALRLRAKMSGGRFAIGPGDGYQVHAASGFLIEPAGDQRDTLA